MEVYKTIYVDQERMVQRERESGVERYRRKMKKR